MTAKEKSIELVEKYLDTIIDRTGTFILSKYCAKQCAKISVEELIKEQTMWQNGDPNPVLYWQDVLKEINKL